MDSKTSKAKRPRTVKIKTKKVNVPIIPREIIDEILGHLTADSDFRSLRSCALASKSWVQLCRRRIFHTTRFTWRNIDRWLKVFPVPEESPAHYVRDLRLSTGGDRCVPDKFFEYTPWFTNVERVYFLGLGTLQPLRVAWFWRLPQSVTSLTIDTGEATLMQIRDLMAHLPNLDTLSLSGTLVTADRRVLSGIGTELRGRFGGQLRLLDGYADEDVMNMLLEVPTGLRFTEVQIRGWYFERLRSTVRLAEACCKTLVKLSFYGE